LRGPRLSLRLKPLRHGVRELLLRDLRREGQWLLLRRGLRARHGRREGLLRRMSLLRGDGLGRRDWDEAETLVDSKRPTELVTMDHTDFLLLRWGRLRVKRSSMGMERRGIRLEAELETRRIRRRGSSLLKGDGMGAETRLTAFLSKARTWLSVAW